MSTALVSFRDPGGYCRPIGGDLSDCTWASLGPAVVCAENLLRYQTFYQQTKYLIGWDIRIMFRQMVSYGLLDATPEDALSRRYQMYEHIWNAEMTAITGTRG